MMPGRVFVTGASGFVGSAVLDELLARGYGINALVRRGTVDRPAGQVNVVPGDLFDIKALEQGMRDCQAVIHLVGIIAERPAQGITFERIHFEGTRRVVDAAVSAGVNRYVQMSALGTRPGAQSEYHRTKYKAEEYVRNITLQWTILRPSMIHGPRGEFMKMEAAWARGAKPPFLFMPYFGAGILGRGGAGLLQPVYVKDVARAFVDAIEKPQTIGQAYDLGGLDPLTWPQLHRAVANAVVGKRRWVMPLPAWYARLLTRVLPAKILPFNRDQVIMSQEDNTADLAHFKTDFGWTPAGFEETLRSYAKELQV